MSHHQVSTLRHWLSYYTSIPSYSFIIDEHCKPDDMLRQVQLLHRNIKLDVLTLPRLMTLLSEGFVVIMWGGYLGEELLPYPLSLDNLTANVSILDIYHRHFDLLDRHEGETPSGNIDDTLVAPYLALVIPQGNSNE